MPDSGNVKGQRQRPLMEEIPFCPYDNKIESFSAYILWLWKYGI